MSELINIENQNTYVNPMAKNISGVMSSELEGLPFSFNKIKIPSGGGLSFEIPGENEDEPEIVKEFTGVILYHHAIRTYYRDKYNGSFVPPNCSSGDGINGTGIPGGSCKTCRYAQYGTADNNGMACKIRRKIYILRQNEVLPVIYELPTSSLWSFSNYISYMFKTGKPTKSIITKFSLKKAQNQNGLTFSQAVFSKMRDLTSEELTIIGELAAQTEIFAKNYNNIIDDDETGKATMNEHFKSMSYEEKPPTNGVMEEISLTDDLPF